MKEIQAKSSNFVCCTNLKLNDHVYTRCTLYMFRHVYYLQEFWEQTTVVHIDLRLILLIQHKNTAQKRSVKTQMYMYNYTGSYMYTYEVTNELLWIQLKRVQLSL